MVEYLNPNIDCWKYSNTVFGIFENNELKCELEKFAIKEGYKLIIGDPGTPDILAFGSFVKIIDRQFLGKETYDIYLDFVDEINNRTDKDDELYSREETVLVIIDNRRELVLPELDFIINVDPTHPFAINWIQTAINLAHYHHGLIKEKRDG